MKTEWRAQWETQGYVVFRGLLNVAQAARMRTICDDVLEQWRAKNADPEKDPTVMRHLNEPNYFTAHPERLGELMDLVAHERILEICRAVISEEPLFRCTSYWFNPRLKDLDGNWHRDSQFVTKTEEDERAMLARGGNAGQGIQLQLALVPSDDIEVVPASHLRWDTPEEYAIRRKDNGEHCRSNHMPGALRIALQPGDMALFNPMGLHRGRYHRDKPRRTLMLTYTKTSEPCDDYFSRQPWFLNPGHMDAWQPATRAFFEPFVRMYGDKWEQQRALQTA